MNFFASRLNALQFQFWGRNQSRKYLWTISVVVSPAARQLWADYNSEVLTPARDGYPDWYTNLSCRIH